MKNITIILVILTAMTIKANAQIPNSGFETWENYVDNFTNFVYEKPDLWVGALPNNLAYSFSIAKNPESYPAGTGQYSMKIQPDIANGVRGVASSQDKSVSGWPPVPSFQLNMRPDSLFLYYKCSPSGGDTILVSTFFYKNGVVIGNPVFGTTQTISNWTPLAIPMTYTTLDIPDSATIILFTGAYVHHSQSTLYVDNLSFNGFISSVSENIAKNTVVNLYPNPCFSTTTIQTEIQLTNATISIDNCFGQTVAQMKNISGQTINFNRNNLVSGIYFVRITENNQMLAVEKLVIADK